MAGILNWRVLCWMPFWSEHSHGLLQGGAGAQPHAGAGSFAGPATTSSAGFLSQQQQLLARQLAQPTGLPLTRLTPLQSQQVTAAAIHHSAFWCLTLITAAMTFQVTRSSSLDAAVPKSQLRWRS